MVGEDIEEGVRIKETASSMRGKKTGRYKERGVVRLRTIM